MTTLCPPYRGLSTEPPPPAKPRCLTRCECSGAAFADVALLVRGGLSLGQACERTGCGRTCGACLPDLHHSLQALSRR